MNKKFVVDMDKYIGSSSAGKNSYKRDETAEFVAYTGADNDQVYSAFNLEKGETIKVNGKKFECTKHSVGKDNGFTRHEVIELQEK